MPTLDFWYEFASTYSYLSAMRIEAAAAARGVAVRWRPFLLGPIFATQGWTTSPFKLLPMKGKYMVRDVTRRAAAHGLPFRMPVDFPQNSLLAARVALVGIADGWVVPFSKALFAAEYGEGREIGRPEALSPILQSIGLDASGILSRARTDENVKARLRASTEEAQSLGIFGAPAFITEDGELFWGDDRLEDALDWATGAARRP